MRYLSLEPNYSTIGNFSELFQCIAALFIATSLLAGRSLRPLSSVPATGLALVGTILELASSLEFSIDDEEEDDGLALTLHILPSLQVHPLVSCQTPPVILSVLVLLYASCHAYVQPEIVLWIRHNNGSLNKWNFFCSHWIWFFHCQGQFLYSRRSNCSPGLQRHENVVVYASSLKMRRQGYGFIKKVSLSTF